MIQLIGFTPFGSQETTRKEVQTGMLKTAHTSEKKKKVSAKELAQD